MTRLRLLPLVAVLIFAACKEKDSEPKPAPAPASQTAAQEKAADARVDALALPTWDEQLQRIGLSRNGVTDVDVVFSGPILHVTQGNRRRSIVVRAAAHTPVIDIRGVDVVEFKRHFPSAVCAINHCAAELERVGMRIVNTNGLPSLNGFNPTRESFVKQVNSLGGLLTGLHDDADDELPPVGSPVRAYIQLDGGEFTSVPYPCDAKFENESDDKYRPFSRESKLAMTFVGNGPALEVVTAANPSVWQRIPLNGPYVSIQIVNWGPPGVSHFHEFEKLAKPPVTLPKVVVKPCLRPFGTVPGCGDVRWP